MYKIIENVKNIDILFKRYSYKDLYYKMLFYDSKTHDNHICLTNIYDIKFSKYHIFNEDMSEDLANIIYEY